LLETSSAINNTNDIERHSYANDFYRGAYTIVRLWYRILGKLLTLLGLQVLTEHAIMSSPLTNNVKLTLPNELQLLRNLQKSEFPIIYKKRQSIGHATTDWRLIISQIC